MSCDLSNFFERSGKWWFARGKDGEVIPILFCPVCGKKIDYDSENKEAKE